MNAMVCGSSQGIGASSAIELSKSGVSVTLVARNKDALKGILLELDSTSNQSHDYIVADFDDPRKLEQTVKTFLKTKNKKFHILINNSGGPQPGKILDAEPSDFLNAFNRHLICNHLLTKLLIEDMKQMYKVNKYIRQEKITDEAKIKEAATGIYKGTIEIPTKVKK